MIIIPYFFQFETAFADNLFKPFEKKNFFCHSTGKNWLLTLYKSPRFLLYLIIIAAIRLWACCDSPGKDLLT